MSMSSSGNPLPDDLIKTVYEGVSKSIVPILIGANSRATMPSQDKVVGGAAGGFVTFDFPNTPSLPPRTRSSVEGSASSWGKAEAYSIEQSDGTSCVRLVIDCNNLAKTWKGSKGAGMPLFLVIVILAVVVYIISAPPGMHVKLATMVHPYLGGLVADIVTKGAKMGKATAA